VQLGPAEILVVLVIALLVFGPTKLPEVGRQVGRAMKEFRQFQQSMSRDMHEVFSEDATAHAEPAPTLPPKESTIDAHSSEVPPSEVPAAEVSAADVADVAGADVRSPELATPDTVPAEDPGESAADPEASA
jgi:sec-independent protein translocase protein TatA